MKKKITVLLLTLLVCGLIMGCGDTASNTGLSLTEDEGATLGSVQKVEDDFYTVEYQGDYKLDKLLAQGVADSNALGAFASEEVLHGLPFPKESIKLACSAFTAKNSDGDVIQGRNMDFALAQNILVRTNPENGYASLSMASGELLNYIDTVPENTVGSLYLLAAPYYVLDGINEKGLSIAILLQTGAENVHQDTGKTPITTTLAVRMCLDKAATVDEAIKLMEQYDMRGLGNANFHYQISDAEGNSVVVEYVNNEMKLNRPEGYGQPVTNFFLTPGVVEAERDGEDRIIKLQAALDENKGVVSNETAWKMLESVKAVHDYDAKTGHDFNTAYSMIFNNTKRSMEICINANFDKKYSYSVDGTF